MREHTSCLCNCPGVGSVLTANGHHELEASVMTHEGRCGAVALVKHVANPIKLAQQVGAWLMPSQPCFGASQTCSVLVLLYLGVSYRVYLTLPPKSTPDRWQCGCGNDKSGTVDNSWWLRQQLR